ncbi:hypothetical protein AVEN_14701-1 [Araneus ventricosus]|uniref:HTH psq-type domain-containing protein n=1 Tax=Araneus ventricosus TaxID=182803 RepID=A0A4Y2X8E0_ARAVE|nr:hypothetical protein AVEN_14701-1 [Araneus ventricosus]
MASRMQLCFQDKLNIIKEIDDEMKQIEAFKKYGLSQSTFASFLKKGNQIEEAVNSSEFNPQRKRLKVATIENIDSAVDSKLINIENKEEEPFKAVNVKEVGENVAGSWGEDTKKKTIRNCCEKGDLCFMEIKQTDND